MILSDKLNFSNIATLSRSVKFELLSLRSLRGPNISILHQIKSTSSHLAPDQHGAEDDLQAVEEVVPDEDDGGSAGRPALARADGFDAGRGCFGNTGDTTAT